MFTTLYKRRADGKIQEWSIAAHLDKICIRYGELGGELTYAERKCHYTNIGKSNQRTPEEQAIFEVESEIRKKRRLGYVDRLSLVDSVKVLPMLAKKFTNWKDGELGYVQPKLNGVRCLARYLEEVGVVLTSRGGKSYHLPHLHEEIKRVLFYLSKDCYLDGELYVHGQSLQKTVSMVKNNNPNIEFHVFDIYNERQPDLNFSSRNLSIYIKDQSFVKVVPTHTITFYEEIMSLYKRYTSMGYEGIIVRKNVKYRPGKRTDAIQKLKPHKEKEFKIMGWDVAEGNHEGCLIFICKTETGKLFRVTPKATLDERRRMDGDDFIGEFLTVKYQELSDSGVPLFPVGLVVRDYE